MTEQHEERRQPPPDSLLAGELIRIGDEARAPLRTRPGLGADSQREMNTSTDLVASGLLIIRACTFASLPAAFRICESSVSRSSWTVNYEMARTMFRDFTWVLHCGSLGPLEHTGGP